MKKRDQIYETLISAVTCGVAFILAAPYLISLAQAAPPITPSGLNTHVDGPVSVNGKTQYDITGGTRPGGGPNLFHSFGNFNVPNNHSANFVNDSGLATSNILGRVNGGNPSNIFGTIQTTGFGNANLFLMNPSGIVFGPNASLNVGGSVTFTTADYLKLADGARFKALPHGVADGLLSAAPVAAFGFLGSHPRAITVQGSQLSVPGGKSLSLVGGDIRITSGTLTAPSGQINLMSIAGRGESRVVPEGLAISERTHRGHIVITGGTEPENVARLNTSGNPGGAVVLRGGRLSLARAEVTSQATEANQTGGAVVVEATKSATLNGVILRTGSDPVFDYQSRAGGGPVSLAAPSVRVSNLTIETSASGGSAPAGDVTVNVRSLTASNLQIHTAGSDPAGGNITLHASGDVTLHNSRVGAQWDPMLEEIRGDITIRAAMLTLQGTAISSYSHSQEGGSDIAIDVGRLTMRGSEIRTETLIAPAQDGTINVSAREAILIDGSGISTFGGSGGLITVSTPRLTLNHLGRIATESEGLRAGDISVNVRTLNMFNGGRIISNVDATPSSTGDINIVASKSIYVAGLGTDDRGREVHSGFENFSVGPDVGRIHIQTPSMQLDDGAVLRVIGHTPSSSDIVLNVGRLDLLRGASIASSGSGISIVVNAAKSITIDHGTITAAPAGPGPGGNVHLHAGKSIQIRNDSSISADNTHYYGGDAGHIVIQAGRSVVSRDSTISAQAGHGNGGTINVDAKNVVLTNSQLTTSVSGGPETVGGRISLHAKNITLRNSQILSTATEGQGGTIGIRSHALHRDAKNVIDASSELGTDGTVIIQRR